MYTSQNKHSHFLRHVFFLLGIYHKNQTFSQLLLLYKHFLQSFTIAFPRILSSFCKSLKTMIIRTLCSIFTLTETFLYLEISLLMHLAVTLMTHSIGFFLVLSCSLIILSFGRIYKVHFFPHYLFFTTLDFLILLYFDSSWQPCYRNYLPDALSW